MILARVEEAARRRSSCSCPIGKLTNIALALKKDPSLANRVRVVWLGSNYPDPGEYNQENDEGALQFILDSTSVPFEIAVVRYGQAVGHGPRTRHARRDPCARWPARARAFASR